MTTILERLVIFIYGASALAAIVGSLFFFIWLL